MSSLWTPGGEVPMERKRPAATDAGAGAASSPGADPMASPDGGDQDAALRAAAEAAGIDLDQLSPEERERAKMMIAEMAETQARLAGTPAAELLANHAAGLYELAAIKLGVRPPQLDDARLAIDALAALVEAAGDRLGEHGAPLREALTNLQAGFLQVAGESGEGGSGNAEA
jgi:hypothetical protein